MEKDKIFFGEHGLTSTSANHVANLAKECIQTIEYALKNISFYKTEVALIGTGNKEVISYGIESVAEIPSMLDKISKAKALIAWLREAIKARERLLNEANCLSLYDYYRIKGITGPVVPEEEHVLTEDEYYSSLNIKERNRYYQLEAEVATIGKFIHPKGEYADAREELKNKEQNPHQVVGSGRDAIIYSYTPSLPKTEVDFMFFKLQDKHRELQAQLNGIKYKCETAINESRLKSSTKYKEEYSLYEKEMRKLEAEKRQYVLEISTALSNLKIVIPDDLSGIYNEITHINK